MPQFLVHARRLTSQPYPPFVVTAQDEVSAARMVQRNWLIIGSVRDYVPEAGQPEPASFKFGPPLSDEGFVKDYASREPDRREQGSHSSAEKAMISVVGLMFGWIIWWRD